MKISELRQIIKQLKEKVLTDPSWSDLLFFYERLLFHTLQEIARYTRVSIIEIETNKSVFTGTYSACVAKLITMEHWKYNII